MHLASVALVASLVFSTSFFLYLRQVRVRFLRTQWAQEQSEDRWARRFMGLALASSIAVVAALCGLLVTEFGWEKDWAEMGGSLAWIVLLLISHRGVDALERSVRNQAILDAKESQREAAATRATAQQPSQG